MPACPSCGRDATDDDRFCPRCGRGLPAPAPVAQQAGGLLVVATFGPTTGWVGKTITYENQQFVLEGLGPISAEGVLEHDRQGHLLWAYAGLREWVQGLVLAHQAAPVAPAAVAAAPQATRPAERGWRRPPRQCSRLLGDDEMSEVR
jgi:zinc-ribbon domain